MRKVMCLQTGKIYKSQAELAEEIGISGAHVALLIGRREKIKGRDYRRFGDESPTKEEALLDLKKIIHSPEIHNKLIELTKRH